MVSLGKNSDFQRVYKRGKFTVTPRMTLYALKRRPYPPKPSVPWTTGPRFGITASAKVGNAIVRNKVRRRIREICRLNISRFLPQTDYVIVARDASAVATYAELHRDMLYLLRKQGN